MKSQWKIIEESMKNQWRVDGESKKGWWGIEHNVDEESIVEPM